MWAMSLRTPRPLAVLACLPAALVVACSGPEPTGVPPTAPTPTTPPDAPGATTTPQAVAPTTGAPAEPSRSPEPSPTRDGPTVLLAAGDVAACDRDGDEATARLLDELSGTVAVLGDLAYPDGTVQQLRDCYAPTWGRHGERTRPALGNHDYGSGSADPYFDHFGPAAGPRGEGYYGYDLDDDWHAVVLNTNCWAVGGCGPGSAQYRWLDEDLAAHADQHVVAYAHHPRFSSGNHGSNDDLADVFSLLHQHGVALFLAGHDHHYERFEPVDASGAPDPDGVRQFVVGTGGYVLYALGDPLPTTEARTNETFGVLELELLPDRYRWRFHPTRPDGLRDHGVTRLGRP